ncbi:threonyl-tRNA synthetase family protein [Besnoitia besnoiti]|uniref:threonine--tRNA ligase n=1 Tax=Besnoitia besnoiti TaxID=94643 RepID=A0A2A9MNU1_BESBE|nr:threonyl-tRNA synthetase family protein [Besnoitia besnoiti]PFH37643.1 threonyl-tRNA synthetase family protein [Besnoitia besnoiti]
MAAPGRRAEQGTAAAIAAEEKIGDPNFQPCENPAFLQKRLALFEALYEKQTQAVKEKPRKEIAVELPDGSKKEGTAFETSPYDVAVQISKGLADASLVAKVLYVEPGVGAEASITAADDDEESCACGNHEGEEANGEKEKWMLWDLKRPLEGSCKLQLLKFDADEAKHVFWHSSAHILGQSIEACFGAQLTVGPALTNGFYYDAYMGSATVTEESYAQLEKAAHRVIKEDQPFRRLVCSRQEALELFADNPFKVQLIRSKIPADGRTTVYRCGQLVDLCRGPHVPSTGKVKAFQVSKHSATYWLGRQNLDSLQRVYGVSFPDKKQLKEYLQLLEEAKKRDHRVVGQNLHLFFFDTNVSPGSCFWLPDGAKVYNKLCEFMREEYRFRGFQEVISPNIFSCDLWKTSGHYQNYKENMYLFDVEGKEWGLKPMNCPGHCIMFKHLAPSYRQLPLRLADFGVLHRNELSGSLTGLTRVRRFQQDDAHIFCRMDQVKKEVADALAFLFYVYEQFGFSFELFLSTRPKKALGERAVWDAAEQALKEALDQVGKPWQLNAGDGAFYGPKIDIRLWDALKRPHQCGTIQLDFQLPIRFNLQYRTQDEAQAAAPDAKEAKEKRCENGAEEKDEVQADANVEQPLRPGMARPVIIHRAILGSIERMCAVIIEHTGGKLPFWLSPRQCIVLPISDKVNDYAASVRDTLHSFGYEVGLDVSNNTVNKKIREAQLQQWNYLLVVGEKERADKTVTVRERADPEHQKVLSMEDLLLLLEKQGMPNSRKTLTVSPRDPRGGRPPRFCHWMRFQGYAVEAGLCARRAHQHNFSWLSYTQRDAASFGARVGSRRLRREKKRKRQD